MKTDCVHLNQHAEMHIHMCMHTHIWMWSHTGGQHSNGPQSIKIRLALLYPWSNLQKTEGKSCHKKL